MSRRVVATATLGLVLSACAAIVGLTDVPELGGGPGSSGGVDLDAGPEGGALADGQADGAASDGSGDAARDGGEAGNPSPTPTSCKVIADGIHDCGPKNNEDCCESPLVVTNKVPFNRDPGPAATATFTTNFRLDKYEVTVGRFRAFLTSAAVSGNTYNPSGLGKHTHLNGGLGLATDDPSGYEKGWTYGPLDTAPFFTKQATDTKGTYAQNPADFGRRPVNDVTWYEAYAFCIWDGGFLPSEAEWVYASANGNEQRPFPWGSAPNANPPPDPPAASVVYFAITSFNHPYGNTKTINTVNQIAPVGFATDGGTAFGQLDLAGNLAEYLLDATNEDPPTSYPTPCTDCARSSGARRVIRGGNYGDAPVGTAVRGSRNPGDRDDYQGFRCARSP